MTINDLLFINFLFEGYRVADQVVKSDDTDVLYYGYINNVGKWYILKWDQSAGANSLQTYRYIKGDSSYATNFAAREALTYDYFDTIFGINH